MDVLFKRYFWVIHLAVIAACGAFAGRAGVHLLSGSYLVDTSAVVSHRNLNFEPPKIHGKEPDQIIKRNVFCSGCMPEKPKEESTDCAVNPSAPNCDQPPQKTSLQLELVSTLVCPTDSAWSMAIIRDLSSKEKEPHMYGTGALLPGTQAMVLAIFEKRVYLRNSGKLEYLDLDAKAEPPKAATVAIEAVAPAMDPNSGDVPDGKVQCSGNNCTVERALVESLLTNTTSLAMAARFVPSMKDGKPNGFKLYAIRPNSIFGRIGLQNGDTIKGINGSDMTTPDAALALYSKLRSASHLSVAVERRNQAVTMDYTIK